MNTLKDENDSNSSDLLKKLDVDKSSFNEDSVYGKLKPNNQDNVENFDYDENNYDSEKHAMILNLSFKDMYVRIDDNVDIEHSSRYNPTPGPGIDTYSCLIVPKEYNEDIHSLRKVLKKSPKNDFAILWGGVRMRVCRFSTTSKESATEQELWCVLRRFPTRLPDIEYLKLNPSDVSVIKAQEKRQGLIVICGGTGAGKTTTGIAILRHFLKSSGGMAYMVEDPPEYIMQGPFDANPENAFVLQREVSEEEEWPQAIKDGLRSNPKFVYLGEVRSPASASQMLRMANSGHLVICTVHGSSIEQGISALIQIARVDQRELADQLLADSLALIIYQRMTPRGPVLTLLEAGEMSDKVRQNIRDGKLKMLGSAIEEQDNSAKNRVKQAQMQANNINNKVLNNTNKSTSTTDKKTSGSSSGKGVFGGLFK